MDEYPYFAESSAEISSILQYTIDHIYKEKNNIMLILCGSSMSFMEHQVLGYKSPLYGRKTGQFKIRPFDIFTTKKMLSKVNNEDLLAYYGITDGIPQYLSFIDQTKSVEENKNELNKKTPPVKTTSGIFSKYLSINFTYLDWQWRCIYSIFLCKPRINLHFNFNLLTNFEMLIRF